MKPEEVVLDIKRAAFGEQYSVRKKTEAEIKAEQCRKDPCQKPILTLIRTPIGCILKYGSALLCVSAGEKIGAAERFVDAVNGVDQER